MIKQSPKDTFYSGDVMHFGESGRINTEEVIRFILKASADNHIQHIVVASVTGDTAMLLTGTGKNAVCVTHADGFKESGVNELSPEIRGKLIAAGIKVLTTTHVLSGVGRGISSKSGGMYPAEIISDTLQMFGHGVKVCVEVAIMALDAGMIHYGENFRY